MEYPHADDPAKFTTWLIDRLQIPNIVWDRETCLPIHTTYDDWNIWGTLSQPAQRSDPPSPLPSLNGSSRRPPLPPRLPSKDSDTSSTEHTHTKITCRISRNELRLQRQYQLLKVLARLDSSGDFHIRGLQLLRLPPRDGYDEAPLAAIILEDAGCINNLRSLVNYGPTWYLITKMPSVTPYDPAVTSDGTGRTGTISVPTFLRFAKAATRCCAFLHDNRIIHGELRTDAFHFNKATNHVRFVNHGHGYRAFENGLSGASWREISQSTGVTFRLQFVAPEQTGRLPASPDNRTDLYSLGIIFYNVLTGEVPFDGNTAMEVLQNLLGRRVPSVSAKRIDIPESISAVVAKMTQRNVEDRYHSAHGLLADLDHIDKVYDQSLVDGNVSLPKDWTAGAQDARCIFRIPDVQVGREREQEEILSVLSQVHKRRKQLSAALQSHAVPADAGLPGFSPSVNGLSLHHTNSVTDNTLSDKASARTDSTMSAGIIDTTQDSQNEGASSASVQRDSIESSSSTNGLRSPHTANHTTNDATSATSISLRNQEKYKRLSKTELIVVYGAVGLGKSRLVQSVLPDARKRGFVSVARFNITSNAPFQALIHLLSSLVRQIFMDTSDLRFHAMFVNLLRPNWETLSSFLSLPTDLLDLHSSGTPDDERSFEELEPSISRSSFDAPSPSQME